MSFLHVHPDDDMLVALETHPRGERVSHHDLTFELLDEIPAKHKVCLRDVPTGGLLKMYGIVVARANQPLRQGQLLTIDNVDHATAEREEGTSAAAWKAPDVSKWADRTFMGYRRHDGRVGTRNHWLVIPMVFCENRNVNVLREAMLEELGFATHSRYQKITRTLVERYRQGASAAAILETAIVAEEVDRPATPIFERVDGIKFLAHDEGCGGALQDSINLCGLLAGYINHPNVAGATVLSLGCQKAQLTTLQDELHRRNPDFKKPLYIFEQQRVGSEETLLTEAIRHTLAGLVDANQAEREPAPLSELVVGLECGGSDGFSGISANPAIGHCSDLLVALGGSVILSEFPELAGCENDLASRCATPEVSKRFLDLMSSYEERCRLDGLGFEGNPSPGNIRDGLITDAIKSAGAAKKGGTSPVTDVLDYPEWVTKRGLNLLRTPGNDVESTTAMAGAGATAMFFSTGLGTPTGNPISPVIKVSTNTEMAEKMADIIDVDAGGVIPGDHRVEEIGERLLDQLILSASGAAPTKAEILGQDDFIPWRQRLTM
ncbi:Altronate dehydratase [Planctomycetes bacterium Pan216]|uniref:Altronate dehydratase n=1 Tax=Kolteria novifilia TaxID=2527975 RepID=A0A518B8K1_9BACT|nr:Altronate dehydratase [Planctomycetes bacterium Pan216]